MWFRARKNKPCPICSGLSGCTWIESAKEPGTIWVTCIRESSGSRGSRTIQGFGTGYIHLLNDQPGAAIAPVYAATPVITHSAYYRLLTGVLSNSHRVYLYSRGFEGDFIKDAKYTTLPAKISDRDMIAEALAAQESLEGVPGFWYTHSADGRREWHLSGPGGILLPVRNADGTISGCVINTDDAITQAFKARVRKSHNEPLEEQPKVLKYCWLTSAPEPAVSEEGINYVRRRTGTKATPHLHFANRWMRSDLFTTFEYLVVEGRLKSDLVASLWEGPETIVGMPGVGTCHGEVLGLALGAASITLAFDADWRTNEGVRQALVSLVTQLLSRNVTVWVLQWNPTLGNGFDDAILNTDGWEWIEKIEGSKWKERIDSGSDLL